VGQGIWHRYRRVVREVSVRNKARKAAETLIENLASQGIAAAVALIERRINWRWGAGAVLLALEAQNMVRLLPRSARLRLAIWKGIERRRVSRALAVDPSFAAQCGICRHEEAAQR